MIKVRLGPERGHFDHGWLDTHHSFSFAGYRDPRYQGFRSLRVLNEDRLQPGTGFETHEHWDLEILTMMLEGELEHRDSLGNGSVIRPGEFQRITAGTGIQHSEFNRSGSEPCHLLQIWLLPARLGLRPEYEQRQFPREERRGRLRMVASPDGRDGALALHQDCRVFTSILDAGQEVVHEMDKGRHAWLQLATGTIHLDDVSLDAGDGAAVSGETSLRIRADAPSELLLFDLA